MFSHTPCIYDLLYAPFLFGTSLNYAMVFKSTVSTLYCKSHRMHAFVKEPNMIHGCSLFVAVTLYDPTADWTQIDCTTNHF